MPKYRVTSHATEEYVVEVEADDRFHAEALSVDMDKTFVETINEETISIVEIPPLGPALEQMEGKD